MKTRTVIGVLLMLLTASILAQESNKPEKKLEFLVGQWECTALNHRTGEKRTGTSKIEWILNDTWLQWKFTIQTDNGPIGVLTLINYHEKKKQYAFYSFNPFDQEPLPHFGHWTDDNALRLKITENEGETWIDFLIKEDGNFDQMHYQVRADGEKILYSTTHYTKYDRKGE